MYAMSPSDTGKAVPALLHLSRLQFQTDGVPAWKPQPDPMLQEALLGDEVRMPQAKFSHLIFAGCRKGNLLAARAAKRSASVFKVALLPPAGANSAA